MITPAAHTPIALVIYPEQVRVVKFFITMGVVFTAFAALSSVYSYSKEEDPKSRSFRATHEKLCLAIGILSAMLAITLVIMPNTVVPNPYNR